MRAHRTSTSAAILAAIASLATCLAAGPSSGQPRDRPGEAQPELRAALRDLFVEVLVDELGIERDRVPAVEPRVHALLDAQREAHQLRGRPGAPPPRAVPAAEALARERAAASRVREARDDLFELLTPRQSARFLALEGRFRDRVREIVTGRKGPNPGPPGRPGREAGGEAPPPGPEADERARQMQDTVALLFVHELRTELELDEARTLGLLPGIGALLDARFEAERQRRDLQRRLRAAAWDESATDAQLSSLVAEAASTDETAVERGLAARAQVLSRLDDEETARFLALEHRFEALARHRPGGAGRPHQGPHARPGDEAARPDGPPRGDGPGGPWRRGGRPR